MSHHNKKERISPRASTPCVRLWMGWFSLKEPQQQQQQSDCRDSSSVLHNDLIEVVNTLRIMRASRPQQTQERGLRSGAAHTHTHTHTQGKSVWIINSSGTKRQVTAGLCSVCDSNPPLDVRLHLLRCSRCFSKTHKAAKLERRNVSIIYTTTLIQK